MVLNFASLFSTVKIRKTKNVEVHVYNGIPFVYIFPTIQWYQRPDSFSAFISSVSSTVRLIWNFTQIEDIKPATRYHSEARLDCTSIVELTLPLLLFSCMTRGIE